MIPATIVYVTHRLEPRWKWFVDALCNQADFDQRRHLNIIVVDGNLWRPGIEKEGLTGKIALADPQYHDADRRIELEQIVNNRLDYLHIPPLPSVYSGPFRLTPRNWFNASGTRNTGFACAHYNYVGQCDDLSLPGTIWLSQILHAAQHNYVVAGMYKKVKKLVVEGGLRVSHEDFPEGVDSRWSQGSDCGIVPWNGSIFGCSFGVPLESALAVDGFEMACAGAGGEDYDFGIRLARAGNNVFLNQNLFTYESEEDHHTQEFKSMATRDRRAVLKKNLPAAYESYSMPNLAERYMSDHVLLNRVRNEARILPMLGLGLREIRREFLATGLVPIPTEPHLDWRDDTPLSTP